MHRNKPNLADPLRECQANRDDEIRRYAFMTHFWYPLLGTGEIDFVIRAVEWSGVGFGYSVCK